MKEQHPLGISELQQKLGKIDQALGKASRVTQTIGTPEFGRPELDISPSTRLDGNAYLDAALKVGRARKGLAEKTIPKLTDFKNQIQGQISDLEVQKEKQEKLQEIRDLVDAGYLPPTVLERTQVNAQAQKEVKKTELDDENLLPKITILPDGKVRLSDGRKFGPKQGELLRSLANTSEQNPKKREQLTDELWPGTNSTHSLKLRFYHLLNLTRKKLVGSGLRLETLMPWEEGIVGVKASYYLKSEDIPVDATAAETVPKETSFRRSRMLKVQEALGIDITAYLREEYEGKGRWVKDIATDLTDKTNGQIRINNGDLYRWFTIYDINIRSRNYMDDPLRREAALRKQAANMQLTFQKRSDRELAILKAKFGENPKEALENLYVTQEISIKRIVEEYGISRYTLEKWFKRFEIPQKEIAVLKPESIDIFTRARSSNCLTTLSLKERQVLEDRYNKGKTLKEIGTEIGMTDGGVRSILNKVLSKLTFQLDLAQSPKS